MILISLGANLPSAAGNPAATLRTALQTLPQRNVAVANVSSFYRSVAWPDPGDPEFVNAVARVETKLEPDALLAVLKEIERAFGRHSAQPNAPRPLDLDIIDYHGRIEIGPPLLPHPRMHARAFVLVPLRDIAPSWRHPVSGLSVAELIGGLPAESRAPTRLE